jgi:hypothetical protein
MVDNSISGRIELPIFASSVAFVENFDIKITGGVSNRTGFEYKLNAIKDSSNNLDINILKFIFNEFNNYLIVNTKGDNKLLFYQHSNNNLIKYSFENASPWTFEEFKQLKTSQNFDYLYCCVSSKIPKQIVRIYDGSGIVTGFNINDVTIETGTGTENPFTIDGNPRCCCFHQGRMFYGGFAKTPNRIWASDLGYYNKFTTNRSNRDDIEDIDGFIADLSEVKMPILWLMSTPMGLIGATYDSIFCLMSSSQLTPFSSICRVLNREGSCSIEPIIMGSSLLYVDNSRTKIKAFIFSNDSQSYNSQNVNIFNSVIFQSKISEFVYLNNEKVPNS